MQTTITTLTLPQLRAEIDGMLWNEEEDRPTQRGDVIDLNHLAALEQRWAQLKLYAPSHIKPIFNDRFALVRSFI